MAAIYALLTVGSVETSKPEQHISTTEWRPFEATAYTAACGGCIGITKTGIDVRHTIVDEEGRRIIAVDPVVIPLGSTLEVRIGNETFSAVAADTGGSIRGARIDVLTATEAAALKFGRQDVEVRVFDEK